MNRPALGRRIASIALPALCGLLALALPGLAAVPAAERSALIALYNSTGGPHWVVRAGWLGSPGSECSWSGVTCDATNVTVVRLFLSDNGLAGSLPAGVGNLPNLQSLEAEGNALSGALPRELGRLANLRVLRLGLNQLSGSPPKELGGLVRLQTLSLPFNHLSGTLAPELGALAELQVLDLSINQLTGAIPLQLGNLRVLTYLDLSGNRLTGPIPAELGHLAALRTLYLGDNQLSGRIPGELGSLENLEQLGLVGQPAQRPHPRGAGAAREPDVPKPAAQSARRHGALRAGQATALVGLLLSQNRLAGTIPGSFYNLTSLETLWLDHNRFTGPVPFELGGIPSLDDDGGLDLRSNALATDTEPGLLADLNLKQAGGSWTGSQAATASFDPSLPLAGLADRRTGKLVVLDP